MEDNRQAVVGLLGGDVEDTVLDVNATDLDYIGIAKAGEGAEAEEIPAFDVAAESSPRRACRMMYRAGIQR